MGYWRRVLAAVGAVLLLSFGSVQASETFDEELYQEQLEESGAQGLMETLPPETQAFLSELGVEGAGWESLAAIEPEGFFQGLYRFFTEGLSQPLAAAGSLMGILLLCSLMSGVQVSFGEKQTGTVLAVVGTLCACAVISPPVISCVYQATQLIRAAGALLLAGTPVLAGILTACGKPVSASGWTIFLLAAGNGVSFLSAAVLLPVMNLFLGLSLVSAVSPEIRLDSLCAVFAKSVRWVLGLVVSIFCSLLTAQTMIASSADGAAVKAGKMLVGFVPVVGSAIGDAMAAVQGCLKLVKSGVGGFALVAALCLFLPVILQCLLWILCCTVCAAAGDLLGLSEISGVLRASGQVLQTLLAILISCLVILIVSGVLMMQ